MKKCKTKWISWGNLIFCKIISSKMETFRLIWIQKLNHNSRLTHKHFDLTLLLLLQLLISKWMNLWFLNYQENFSRILKETGVLTIEESLIMAVSFKRKDSRIIKIITSGNSTLPWLQLWHMTFFKFRILVWMQKQILNIKRIWS